MIHCLYNAQSNALLGISYDPYDLQVGQGQVTLDRQMPDLTFEEWNPAILSFFTKLDTPITKLQFMQRFTAEEYAAIKSAVSVNGEIDFFWQKFLMAQDIVISNPELVDGLNALESAGLLASGRTAEILA